MTKRFQLLFLLCLGFAAGCSGGLGGGDGELTPTPPVPVFGDFILNVATTGSTVTANGSSKFVAKSQVALADGNIKIDETRNTISEISFEAEGAAESEVEFPGAFVVELVKGGEIVNQEFPDFGVIQLPSAQYRRFEFKFIRLESNDIPQELLEDPFVNALLLDQSFLVAGRFLEAADKDIDGNGQVNLIPFQIFSDNEVEIRVSSPNAFEISPDKVNFFFIVLKLEVWFNGILPELQDLEAGDLVQGVAMINKDHPSDKVRGILDHFEANTELSAKSAPSEDGEFDDDDIDEESESGQSGDDGPI